MDARPPRPAARTKLTAQQERRLIAFLDDKFLNLTRGYMKRSQPSKAHLATLTADFLAAATPLLQLILKIPPSAVPGHSAPMDTSGMTSLLDWLDDLDQAWVWVLSVPSWDPVNGPADTEPDAETTSPVSRATQTERTRLRGLLVGGAAALEEWLGGGVPSVCSGTTTERDRDGDAEDDDEDEDVADVLARPRWGCKTAGGAWRHRGTSPDLNTSVLAMRIADLPLVPTGYDFRRICARRRCSDPPPLYPIYEYLALESSHFRNTSLPKCPMVFEDIGRTRQDHLQTMSSGSHGLRCAVLLFDPIKPPSSEHRVSSVCGKYGLGLVVDAVPSNVITPNAKVPAKPLDDRHGVPESLY
ncbi:hypothetical protein B0H15DRAFT_1023675 [Mycena belliarum]|uniref:Uncharacterized protein n=1 Tax=Mycena belliarum TaxID=1033014 RepID=A0AAD6U2P1_9AGAR|nr:hypothetical protein B0H15DRAFT_1023675 [Mycena belliae]